jgi:putative nucleotidyltransferase with HDIG domain
VLETLRSGVSEPAWVVGGAVRDRLLGRATADFDVALAGDQRAAARALARAAGGHAFCLSEGFGAWRVVAHDRSWQVDLLALNGETIEADLARRDVTINAIAEPLRGGPHVDPFGGIADLRARRLTMVSAQAFAEDPLRSIRIVRLACELGFEVEPATAAAAREQAPGLGRVAPERVFAELKRIVISDRVLEGLALMDSLQVTEAVLPELTRLRGVEQSRYHHLDVHDHTRAVLAETIELERRPGQWFAGHATAIEALLSEPLANELTRGQALRFGALLHDVAKPSTRAVTPEGRVTFMGHDRSGAVLAQTVFARLRASERLAEHVAALVRNHLRLGFLVHQMPLGRRAVYRYLRECEPVQADVTLLSVADRLATRGRGSEEAIARHLELARQLIGDALAWRSARPRPPVRGDQLARALGVDPGPELGRLLETLEEESFAGEIEGTSQAIERARELLGSGHSR